MLNEMKSRSLSGKITKILTILCLCTFSLQAQDITNKLGGDTANETYDVTDSADNVLFRVQGDKGALFTGTYGSGTIPATGAGTRMMWYPQKAAFRVGYVDGTQWDDANIGNYSTAFGYGTTASGIYSTAMGSFTTASGYYSIAMGNSSTASGNYSTAMGREIQASGDYSFAIALNDQNGTNVTQDNGYYGRQGWYWYYIAGR